MWHECEANRKSGPRECLKFRCCLIHRTGATEWLAITKQYNNNHSWALLDSGPKQLYLIFIFSILLTQSFNTETQLYEFYLSKWKWMNPLKIHPLNRSNRNITQTNICHFNFQWIFLLNDAMKNEWSMTSCRKQWIAIICFEAWLDTVFDDLENCLSPPRRFAWLPRFQEQTNCNEEKIYKENRKKRFPSG